jgi:capping protein alpha
MSAEAAKALLRTAAPGQFDAVAENVQKLGQLSGGSWLTEAQLELKKFQCTEGLSNNSNHPLAAELREKMEDYQKENFLGKPGVTARVVLTSGVGDGLVVHTYAEKIDPSNKHSGNWKATWTIDKAFTEMSGHVVVHSYAYEEGNAQLKIDKEFPAVLVQQESSSKAGGVVQQIMTWETIILGILTSMNDDVTSDHLRSIRRVLPITKTKMNWDAVAHRSVKTLKKSAPETRSKVKYGN